MNFRVRYTYDNDWVGEVKDNEYGVWIRVTNIYFTKYGAKHALRKWYKKHITPDKIEEVNPEDWIGGRHINTLKPLLICLIVVCIMFFIRVMCV